MILILDRQHFGKPGKDDRGAAYQIDGRTVHEIDLTLAYIRAIKAEAERRGHRVVLLDSGWYGARHEAANQIARGNPGEQVVYFACHTNAGGGTYALFGYDHRSAGGKALAAAVAHAMAEDRPPGVSRILAPACSPDEWANCYHTIDGIWLGPSNIRGLCLEPGFPDHPDHRWLATEEGAAQLARILVTGAEAVAGEGVA